MAGKFKINTSCFRVTCLVLFVFLFLIGNIKAQKTRYVVGPSIGMNSFSSKLVGLLADQSEQVNTMGKLSIGWQTSGVVPYQRQKILNHNGLIDFLVTQKHSGTQQIRTVGFRFGFLMGLNLTRKTKNVDFLVCSGLTLGDMRLAANRSLIAVNSFACAAAMVQPGIHVGKMGISLRIGYEYDFSNGEWKMRGDDSSYKPKDWNQSCWSVKLVIGKSFRS